MADPTQKGLYSHLSKIDDENLRRLLKLMLDKLHATDDSAQSIGLVTKPLLKALDAAKNPLTNVKDPVAKQDAATKAYVDTAIRKQFIVDAKLNPTPVPPPPPGPSTPPTQPSGGTCYTNLAAGQPLGVPTPPNKRWFRGDFCGISVGGLPKVPGGSSDTSVVFTPFIDRYGAADQANIFAAYKARGYTHFKLSWPDSRDGASQSIAQFVATCQLVQSNGFYPVVFLTSKDFDPVNPAPSSLDPILGALIAGACVPIACVGWELNWFNTPGPTFQALINKVTDTLVPNGTNVYVHFTEGYVAWQAPGDPGSAFWTSNVGKLTGVLHQKVLTQDCGLYQSRLADLQVRFGTGVAGYPTDSGFGHPFDIVADEYSASYRFNGVMTETAAKVIGNQAICSPGPAGTPTPLAIQGFLNGGPNV